jgi:hypothetical protein
MRRMKLIGVAALVATIMLVAASPVTAVGVAMRASADVTFEQPTTFCAPEELVIEGSGPGTLTLDAFDGDVEAEMSQCTGFVVGGPFDPEATVTVGTVTNGFFTLTAADDGGVLVLTYEGGFVANSQGTIGYGNWEVWDSSGIFAGAYGPGGMHLFGEEPVALHVELMGSVVVP